MAGHKQHIQANNIGNMRKSVSTDNIGNNFIGNNVPVQSQANRTALHSTSTRISHTTQSNHDASQRFTSSPSDNQQFHQRNRIQKTQDIPSNRMRQIQQRQQFHNQENVHERAVFAADDMENINEHKQQQIRSQFITNSQQQHHVLPNNQRNGSKHGKTLNGHDQSPEKEHDCSFKDNNNTNNTINSNNSSNNKKTKNKKNKKKGSIVPKIIIALVFIIGLGCVLYPTISDFIYKLMNNYDIQDYQTVVDNMDYEKTAALIDSARDYNAQLAQVQSSATDTPDSLKPRYENELTISGAGIMGYITIPKVGISLPIYHGTSDDVLQHGVGHLEGTSLPIGGESTHSVLSAHTGLPSAKLFTDIDQLKEGDTFNIHILNEVHTYEIDSIQVVLPEEVDMLRIVPGQDYITLLTCTPYGINTHRLLVRGHPVTKVENIVIRDYRLEFLIEGFVFPVAIIGLATVCAAAISLHFTKTYRQRKKAMKQAVKNIKKRQK